MTAPAPDSPSPVQVLICYSPKDTKLKDTLHNHLSRALDQREFVLTDIQRVDPGAALSQERVALLMSAPVIICLISIDYFTWMQAHADIYERLIERYRREEVYLIPVLLRATALDDALAGLEILPRNRVPLTEWPNKDSAFAEIADELQKVIKRLLVDRAIRRACRIAGLPPATPARDAETHAVCHYLTPFVAGRSVLWIESRPERIEAEVSMFKELRAQVSITAESESAQAFLAAAEQQHLVITNWHGGATEGGGDECLDLSRAMRDHGLQVPLIVYSPLVDDAQTARRREAIRGTCISGLTHCPRELFKWGVVELLRSRGLDRNELLIPPALLPSFPREKG